MTTTGRNRNQDVGGEIARTEHTAGAAFGVNAPPPPEMVQLYHPETTKRMYVEEADVQSWLAQGFTRQPLDARQLFGDLQVYTRAWLEAVGLYVEGVMSDGYIDTGDEANQVSAMAAGRQVEETWGLVQRAINQRYPVRQGDPVRMLDADGVERAVDPGQVEQYQAEHGFTTADF